MRGRGVVRYTIEERKSMGRSGKVEGTAVNHTGQRIVHRIRKIKSETRLGSADGIITEGGRS